VTVTDETLTERFEASRPRLHAIAVLEVAVEHGRIVEIDA
jgi:hypothetical protein